MNSLIPHALYDVIMWNTKKKIHKAMTHFFFWKKQKIKTKKKKTKKIPVDYIDGKLIKVWKVWQICLLIETDF